MSQKNKKFKSSQTYKTPKPPAFKGNPFDLQNQFEQYLKLSKIDSIDKEGRPYKELRKAFYAGIGSFLVFQSQVLAELPENDILLAIDKVRVDLQKFWKSEVKNNSKGAV